ncbi:metal-dependent hydrolase [Heyndrickxia acidicola]|uniref:Metal-dependent hydrolase n=1 Tax=Heyndrickxia acidicola TaxID=209389 RepID=A0ABU6MIR6_9BACI|nr:metal-dependent hydrolase [Heyndrickxia acidicola]MED1204563.1 metal-dependent hydrolase [Heyndrickxia acidicola]
MQGKTHVLGGAAAGLLYLSVNSANDPLLFVSSCAVGALIPDIDHTGSTLGRKIPLLDNVISGLFGHRTFTHSLLFLFLAFLLFKFTHWNIDFEFGILIGMFSHMVLDALTKEGIQFLWPLKIRIRIPLGIRTGGPLEKVFMLALVLYIAYCGYQKIV